ncbi:MAG: NIPSNAP family protein [Candidatus Tectomicrobia bacterium]|uniref:NIPSNAP family protein n=1 Tax=Tectimicrobiota bacterium TaxID=2528274 RepID=A0A933GLQ3_UNCTE|nr:NIPSNAP family protein [Candidatus Tectomicrobia bacterium]
MIYEMRTYTLKPGSVDTVEKLFAESLPHRLKYSKLTAFWHTEIGPLNQIIHLWEYNDLNHRTEVRAKSMKDPNWPPKIAEYIVEMESKILIPAAFSPIK